MNPLTDVTGMCVEVINLEAFNSEIMRATVVVLGKYKGNFPPFKIPVLVSEAGQFLPGTAVDLIFNQVPKGKV